MHHLKKRISIFIISLVLLIGVSACSFFQTRSTNCPSPICMDVFASWSHGGVNSGLATDDTYVYWTDREGKILKGSKNAKSGAAPTILVSGLEWPHAIALDTTSVYFIDIASPSTLQKVNKEGGPATVLATFSSNEEPPVGLAVDENYVYVVRGKNEAPWSLLKVPKDGGKPTVMDSGKEVKGALEGCFESSISLDKTTVYWTTRSQVHKIPKEGGQPIVLSSITCPHGQSWITSGMTNDSKNVYWPERCGHIARISKDGEKNPTVLWSNGRYPTALTVDGKNIYWIDSEKMTLEKIQNDGQIVSLAAQQDSLHALVIDTSELYWISGKTLMKGQLK